MSKIQLSKNEILFMIAMISFGIACSIEIWNLIPLFAFFGFAILMILVERDP